MLHRGVAIVGLFALSPAHATLIEHPLTLTVTNVAGDVRDDFGAESGDTIAGGFLFAYAPPRAHYAQVWRLQTRGDDRQANRYFAQWVEFCLGERLIGPLTNSGLRVPDASEWRHGALSRWGDLSFAGNSPSIHTRTEGVPEPATLSLLGAGLLGMLAARRRRRVADV